MKKKIMFMVHPANSGCEIYVPLAQLLKGQYECYGIDSYNLHHAVKKDSLHELAVYYLESIQETVKPIGQDEVVLLGWSLGGQICLEMAGILEEKGHQKIKAYLLDTILPDAKIVEIRQQADRDLVRLQMKERLKEFDLTYADKVLNNAKVDWSLASQSLSRQLVYTHSILFKAMLPEPVDTEIIQGLSAYLQGLKLNNIEQAYDVAHLSKFKMIEVANATHATILEQGSFLVSQILANE